MKNIGLKIVAWVILIGIITIPILGGFNYAQPDLINESTTTLISEEKEEIISEIETEDTIKMISTFEDKLKLVTTKSPKKLSPVVETTEVQVIEEPSTTTQSENKQSTSITTTTEESYYVYSEKYSTAATIWNYLRDLGYSKVVCAGILGNIMAEVGGHTLHIQPYLSGDGYYGICQWSTYYCPSVAGAGLYDQLSYLARTIKSEFNNFGHRYYDGFNHSHFANLSDIGAAARAFAICYERCASWSYSSRVNNAYRAYEYFA